jgi:phosphoglycolate phosphatase-like HAD superfamily hydrolase
VISWAEQQTWFLDCDGVLLDSNSAKTEAFRAAALPYGERAAQRLTRHHLLNGGVTRQAKADYFFTHILGREPAGGEREGFLESFALAARAGVREADLDPAAVLLLEALRSAGRRVFVVTGGSEEEVRAELVRRGIAGLFDGVHGNPRDKFEIVTDLLESGRAVKPAVVVGDGAMDARLAERFRLDFVFVEHWSEWPSSSRSLPPRSVIVHDLLELHQLVAGDQ